MRAARIGALALALAAGAASAFDVQDRDSSVDPALMQIDEPKYLGKPLQRSTTLVDAEGKAFTLGDMLGKPVILLLSYYGCDGTCPTMNRNLAEVLAQVKRFRLGPDYRVLTVSFDRQDTSGTAASFLAKNPPVPEAMRSGWRHAVLRAPEQDAAAFAGSVGFRFFWSREDKVFLHPNVLVFLTPEGRVARYIYGTRMDPATVELALIDADWGRISTSTAIFDMLSGACYSYNYAEGRYQPNYSLLAGVGSLISGLALMLFGAWFYRRRMGRASHGH